MSRRSPYPNGFVIHLHVLPNPNEGFDLHDLMRRHGHRPVRVGVRFSDGREGGRSAQPDPFRAPKDADGLPSGPVVFPRGGRGGTGGWSFGFWVYPLPPVGPVQVFIALADLPEIRLELDGGSIRSAAERATVIWS